MPGLAKKTNPAKLSLVMKVVQYAVIHTTENPNFREDHDFLKWTLPDFFFLFFPQVKDSFFIHSHLKISSLWSHFPRTLRSVVERFTIGSVSRASPNRLVPDRTFVHLVSALLHHDSAEQANFLVISQQVPLHKARTLIKRCSIQSAFGEPTTNPFRKHYTKAAAELGMLCKVLQGGKAWLQVSILPPHSLGT